MEVIDAIFTRRSVRSYLPRPVCVADLEEILGAGSYAPSAVNLQPWYFVALRNPEQLERLAKIMGRVSRDIEPALAERFAKHPQVVAETTQFIRSLGGAPVCILVFQYKPEYPKTETTIVQSIGAAIENLLLAATSKGLGSCWLTAPVETGAGPELRDAFAPGKGDLVALLTLGYPGQTPKAPARKEGRYIIF